jgi:hypothetical protein
LPGVVKILFFLQKVDPIFIPLKNIDLKKTIIFKGVVVGWANLAHLSKDGGQQKGYTHPTF